MSVVFEYISRNYILDYEYMALKLPILGRAGARYLLHRDSHFKHRVFLMFRQKWFLLLCVVQSEPMRTLNHRLRVPLSNREILRVTLEAQYNSFGFDRDAEFRLLESIWRNIEPLQAELIANVLGSFDIHLVDGLSIMMDRARAIEQINDPRDLDLTFEIATFSHLDSVFQTLKKRAPQACDLLIPYVKYKYGVFLANLNYPTFAMRNAIESKVGGKKASIYGEQLETALRGLDYISFAELPSVLFDFGRSEST